MSTIQLKDFNNITNLCRVCLTKSKKMLPLTAPAGKRSEANVGIISHLLQKIVNTKIICNNKYPSFICPMCLGLLKITYKFKLQFETSEKLLFNYFGEEKEVDNKDEAEAEAATVVLITNGNKYDLNDIVVIEEASEDVENYEGFLKNLGKEVSASFVKLKSDFIKNDRQANDTSEAVLSQSLEIQDTTSKKVVEKRFKCILCSKSFSTTSVLKRHESERHYFTKGQDGFVCELCGIVLKTRSSYYHHVVKHSGKQYKCLYCIKRYFSSSNLKKHVAAVHKNERRHLCTVCGKSFNYANAVDYHMRIHTNERKYKCTYCGKTFRMQCGLNRHLRTHTGVRPYVCSFCQQGYRSKGELDCHVMTHTGYRPYHCKYCKKGFTKRYNLKMHLLQHPGQHACYICKKTFAEIVSLKHHYKHAHHIEDKSDNGE